MKRIIWITICLILFSSFSYAESSLEFMKGSINIVNQQDYATINRTLENYIVNNLQSNTNTKMIKIQLLRDNDSSLYALIHVFSRYFSTYHTIRVNLNSDGSHIVSADKNYIIKSSDILNQNKILNIQEGVCPKEYNVSQPLFVIASPASGTTKSMAKAVNSISSYVNQNRKYKLARLYDREITIQEYKNILACPNLSQMVTISSEDDLGKTFHLDDGLFDADDFKQVKFNSADSIFVLDVCNAFRDIEQGFCRNITEMPGHPSIYTAGSSELLLFGAPETYTCMWRQYLLGHIVPNIALLNECAKQNDPSFEGYNSGIYFVGDLPDGKAKIIIKTDKGRQILIEKGDYKIVVLDKDEAVVNYSIEAQGKSITCSANQENKINLINNKGLLNGEFVLEYDSFSTNPPTFCKFEEISRMTRWPGKETRDVYGMYPDEKCYENRRF